MERKGLLLAGLGSFALGVGVGAGMMFVLDPASGARRRSRLLGWTVGSAPPDAGGGEATLEARVRGELSRLVRNPEQIEVTARGNCVTLSGWVLADELDDVLDEVNALQGVDEVYNLLQVLVPAPYVSGHH